MNRRQFLKSTIVLASVAGTAGISIVTHADDALAYRPLTSNGDGDGGDKPRNKRKGNGKHRKHRDDSN